MDIFAENCRVLKSRFPDFFRLVEQQEISEQDVSFLDGASYTFAYKDIQISSNYDHEAEANLQTSKIPVSAAKAYVYGVSNGCAIEQLLNRKALKRLVVSPLSLPIFITSMHYFDHRQWLSDDRVDLKDVAGAGDVSFPFIAFPAELTCADDTAAVLRDRICLELDTAFMNRNNKSDSVDIVQAFSENSSLVENDHDVLELYESDSEKLFVVAAAGPTLSRHFTWLKAQRNKITLIAVDACVKPLQASQIVPDIIVSIDALAGELFKQVDLAPLTDTALVYFPRMSHQFLSAWPGKRFTAYSQSPLYDELYAKYPKGRLFSAGSVIHPAIDLANQMGAKKILLLGADFSFPNNQSHVTGTEIVGKNKQVFAPEQSQHWVLNGFGNKVATHLNFRGFLRDLERYIEEHSAIEFYNGSLHGAKIAKAELWHEFKE